MGISKLQAPPIPPYATLTVDEALAQMKSQVNERFATWAHRTQALAAVRYVADYFDLQMGDRSVRRAAFGLMENDYDADQLRHAKQRLLVDQSFARKRRATASAIVEAADFERALRRTAPTSAMRRSVPGKPPPVDTPAPPARN